MTISERLFFIMHEKGVSMPELSRRTGISRHTIFDWQKKNTNPGADKIMPICEALKITPEELLVGRPEGSASMYRGEIGEKEYEVQILEGSRKLSESQRRQMIAYMHMLINRKNKD